MFNSVAKTWHISNHPKCNKSLNKMKKGYEVLKTISKYILALFHAIPNYNLFLVVYY